MIVGDPFASFVKDPITYFLLVPCRLSFFHEMIFPSDLTPSENP